MAGFGLLLAGLSGAGKGLAASAEQEQKVSDEQMLMKQRSDLEEQKQLRIAEATRQATRQAGIKQGQDIGSAVTQMQNERDAAAINAANAGVEGGSNMTAADAQVLRDQPEARKAYGLLNPTRQSELEDRATAAERLGYLDAAKETRGTLQTEITNQRNEALDKSTNKRLDQQAEQNKATQEYQQRREDRLDRLASAQLEFSKARANKEDARSEQMAAREERMATVAAMKGVETDLKMIQKDLADPMLAPEQKAVLQTQRDQLMSEHNRYRAALAGTGIEGAAAPSKPFNPADFALNKGGSPGKQGGTTVPNPLANDKTAEPQNTKAMAVSAIDSALAKVSRDLASANARGDKAEVERLTAQFNELSQGRARAKQ